MKTAVIVCTYDKEKEKLDIIQYLVEHGADIHQDDNKVLLNSIKNGHVNTVRYLVSKGAVIPKNACLLTDNIEMMKYLVEECKALVYSIEHGWFDIVDCLLENGVKIDQSVVNCVKRIKSFMNKTTLEKRDTTTEHNKPYNNIYIDTAVSGNLNALKKLEENKDVNAYSRDVALSRCCEYGYIDIVRYIVEQGGDVKWNDSECVFLSTIYGQYDICKYLLEQGASTKVLHSYHHEPNAMIVLLNQDKEYRANIVRILKLTKVVNKHRLSSQLEDLHICE